MAACENNGAAALRQMAAHGIAKLSKAMAYGEARKKKKKKRETYTGVCGENKHQNGIKENIVNEAVTRDVVTERRIW